MNCWCVCCRTEGPGGDHRALWCALFGGEADGASWRSGEGDQEASDSQPGHTASSAHEQGQARDLPGGAQETQE